MKREKEILISTILLIMLFALIFRMHLIDFSSIRADEGSTIYIAEGTLSQIMSSIKGDVQPPLYYTVLHYWMLFFGKSEFSVRILSTIFSVLTIPFIFLIGKKLFNNDTGLLSALFFAVSQANIRFSQIARNYEFLVFLVTASVFFFISYLKENRKSYLVFYILFSVLSIYTHYYASFVVISIVLFMILQHKSYKILIKPFLVSIILILLLVSPLVPLFLTQNHIKTSFEPGLTEGDPLTKLNTLSLNQNNIFARVALIFYHMSVGYLEINTHSLAFLTLFVLIIMVFGTALYSAFSNLKNQRDNFLLLFLPIAIPTAILAFVWLFKLITPYTYTRYLLFISPLYYIFISHGILNAKNLKLPLHVKLYPILFVILIMLFNSVSLQHYYTLDTQKENWRTTSQFLRASSEDVILLYPASYTYNLKYYYKEESKMYALPANLDITHDIPFPQLYSALSSVTETNKCNFKNVITPATNRIYLIVVNPQQSDPQNLLNQCISESYTNTDTFKNIYKDSKGFKHEDIVIYLYSK